VAAELSAPVSDFEKASLYLFAEEWRTDVTHEAFKRRLIDHPLVNVGSETAKGELVYDLITGQVTAKGGRPNTAYREMLRLAMDILKSIRLRYYNYYSVNLLHSDEGAAVYEEFLNRYVPLEANEVAIIKEIEMGIGAQGRTYAVNTSNPAADALTTYNLMMRVVESYNIGDTMTARAGVSALIQAPINYQSAVRFSVNTDHLGRSHLTREGTVIAVAFAKDKKKADASKNPDVHYIVSKSIGKDEKEWPLSGGKTDFNALFNRNNYENEMWVKVRSMSDATPTHVIRLTDTGEVKLNLTPYGDYLKLGDKLRQASQVIAPPQQGNQRPRRGRIQPNPGVMSNMAFDSSARRDEIYVEGQKKILEQVAAWDEKHFEDLLDKAMREQGNMDTYRVELPKALMDHEVTDPNLAKRDAYFALDDILTSLAQDKLHDRSHYIRLVEQELERLYNGKFSIIEREKRNMDSPRYPIKIFAISHTPGVRTPQMPPMPPMPVGYGQIPVRTNPVRVGGTKMTPQEVVDVIKAQHDSLGKHSMNNVASLNAAIRKAQSGDAYRPRPYVIYGSNGYVNWSDETARTAARRLNEPSIVDVPSYVDWANSGDLQDIIVYHYTGQDDGFFPYGIPSKMGWGQLDMTQDEINAARKSSRSNPVTVGQGQHFFIQLRNPSQFKFTAAEKKNAKRSKGTMAIAGKPGTDNTGLRDLLGGFEDAGYVAWKAEHKDSGTRMPWIIQLPRKKGKAGKILFKKARVTDKDTGRSYSTIKPFTANKKIKAAWEKFIALYGEPIYAENPKKRSLFRIRRKNRGRYYKRK